MKLFKVIKFAVIAILIMAIAAPVSTDAATVKSSDLMNLTKTVSNNSIVKGDTTDVTLTVKGTPKDSTFVKPNDVILIIDKSGSMATDNRITAARESAKEFIDLMDLTKHELGIVDYSTTASALPLTTDKEIAKNYVNTLVANGSTNTGDAIRKATDMLSNHRVDAQPTIIIMTDGAADSSSDALAASKAAKDAGITFYSIALLGAKENPTTSAPNLLLMDMASSANHHHFVLGSIGLSEVYKIIVEEIGLASAYNVTITDTISPEFELVPGSYENHIPRPTVNGNTISWFISELKSNELSFTYQIRAKESATANKYTVGQTSTSFEIGDGSTYNLNTTNPIVEIKNHAPIITSIDANKGLTTGGETVTITGQNFLKGAKVYFGSTLATVISESANSIVVTTPVGTQGSVNVKVLNSDGQFALGNYNYYANPTVENVSPSTGEMVGGNTVVVIGTNFMNGAIVYINGIESKTTFSTKSKLSVIVPQSTVDGTVSVKVVNPDGTTAEKSDAYTYLTPPPPPVIELESLTVLSGEMAGGNQVYLVGKNFNPNVKVYFGNTEATVNYYASSSKIRVTVPASATPGLVNVKVENPDGSTAELTNAYEYNAKAVAPAPEISYLSEDNALINVAKTIYLFGKNINPSAKVFLGDIEVPVTFVTNSKIRIAIPASSVPYTADVKLINADGQEVILPNAFTYTEPVLDPKPVVTSLSSTGGSIAGNDVVIVTGQNFKAGAKVYFGGKAGIIVSITDTEIQVKTPVSAIGGLVSVQVVNSDGQESTLNDAYTYEDLKATITKLSVESGSVKGGTSVTITGTNFNANLTVTVDNKKVAYTYLAANRIRIVMPAAAAAGTVEVTIDRSGAKATALYTYN